jgi:hypothetical protein
MTTRKLVKLLVFHVGVRRERCLRDIFTGLKHAILTPAILGRIGKVRLGLEFGAVGF